jgi:RNA 2',3'-cyclic 3'-phosphodiesterase
VAVSGSLAAYDAVATQLPPAGTPGAPRWSGRSMWHVTVAFIGEHDPRTLLEPLTGLGGGPFRLRFRGVGVFPAAGPPRVLWAGVAGDLDALHALAAAVRRVAGAAGARPEPRPYRPHLTLGMWRPGEAADPGCAPGLASHDGPPFTVTTYALYASHGDRYERLRAYQA